MAIVLNTGFSIGSKDLIYDKFVLTKDEMLNIHENTYPDQFFALCSDNDSLYVFNVNNTPNTETGKFAQYSSGTSGDVDLTGYYMAGVDNASALRPSVQAYVKEKLGIDHKYGYFYSGNLLINSAKPSTARDKSSDAEESKSFRIRISCSILSSLPRIFPNSLFVNY